MPGIPILIIYAWFNFSGVDIRDLFLSLAVITIPYVFLMVVIQLILDKTFFKNAGSLISFAIITVLGSLMIAGIITLNLPWS